MREITLGQIFLIYVKHLSFNFLKDELCITWMMRSCKHAICMAYTTISQMKLSSRSAHLNP